MTLSRPPPDSPRPNRFRLVPELIIFGVSDIFHLGSVSNVRGNLPLPSVIFFECQNLAIQGFCGAWGLVLRVYTFSFEHRGGRQQRAGAIFGITRFGKSVRPRYRASGAGIYSRTPRLLREEREGRVPFYRGRTESSYRYVRSPLIGLICNRFDPLRGRR